MEEQTVADQLYDACKNGQLEDAKRLIPLVSDNVSYYLDRTYFYMRIHSHISIYMETCAYTEIIKLFVKHNKSHYNFSSFLKRVCVDGKYELVKYIYESGIFMINCEETILETCYHGNIHVLPLIFTYEEASYSLKKVIGDSYKEGWLPVLKKLILYEPNFNFDLALSEACELDDESVIVFLLECVERNMTHKYATYSKLTVESSDQTRKMMLQYIYKLIAGHRVSKTALCVLLNYGYILITWSPKSLEIDTCRIWKQRILTQFVDNLHIPLYDINIITNIINEYVAYDCVDDQCKCREYMNSA